MLKRAARFIAFILVIASMCSLIVVAHAVEPLDEEAITCEAAMLLDEDTGYVFYSKNPTQQIRPASTTKILTAVIVMERLDMNTEITVGSQINNLSKGSSLMGLVEGEVVTVEQLMYGLMLKSGNDAAVVLACEIGGSIDGFAEYMNQKAAEIGMVNSHFVNPHGLDNDEHYTTVEDMALLTRYALTNYPQIKEFGGTRRYVMPATNKQGEREFTNTNKFLYNKSDADDDKYLYGSATGLKTGTTPKAGGCLVATATKGSQNLIALVYADFSKSSDGNTTGIKRYDIARKLFDYGFDNYENLDIGALLSDVEITLEVTGAATLDPSGGILKCTPIVDENSVITVEQGVTDVSAGEITTEVTPNPGLTAPIKEGDIVGTAVYKLGDIVIYRGDIQAAYRIRSQQEYDADIAAGLITPIEKEEKEEKTTLDTAKDTGLLWLWLLIPAGLIVFLIVRAFIVSAPKKHRYTQARPPRASGRRATPSRSWRRRRRL